MTEIREDIVVYDVEANGLLHKVTKVWVIAAISLCGNKQWVFTDQHCFDHTPDGSLEDGVKFLKSRKMIICHNMMGYDYPLFEKFWPEIWNRKDVPFKKCWDTFAQSKCQHFDRSHLKGVKSNHSLEYYGVMFKYPKPPIEDWSEWDEAKLDRVLKDIEINRKAFNYLNKEAKKAEVDFKKQIKRTQATQYWYTQQELAGFYGNVELMKESVEELDKILTELANEIEPCLPMQVKPKSAKCTWEDIRDKWADFYRKVPPTEYDENEKPIKKAYLPTLRYKLKSGKYDRHTAAWFDISDDREESGYLIEGPYTKVEFLHPKMSQHAVVKEYLLTQGWKPTQWNYEKDKDGALKRDERRQLIKKSPKLTEDSFDSIEGGIGEKIAQYNTMTHRRRTILNEKDDTKGWINQIRPDGRLSAGALAWQTGTGRAAQFGIVNVPSSAAVYGSRMREVWTAPEGNILVSVDMDGAQMRLLANYMNDPVYTEAVLNGDEEDEDGNYIGTDAHTMNARAFGLLTDELWEEARATQDPDKVKLCSDIRKICKNGFYALLFGAGDEKMANTLKIKGGKAAGAAAKEKFKAKLHKAGELQEYLVKQWKENSFRRGGYIEVAGNTWVWCPSEHKLLNYLLMGSEAVIQNEAICWVNPEMEKRGLSGEQKAAIHDELTFEFPLTEEKEGIILLSEMYTVASQKCGLDVIVSGTAKSGVSWLDVH